MKKRIVTLFLTLLMLLSLSAVAFAYSEGGMPLVTDSAGLLTEDENAALNELADELSAEYACEIIVVTVDSLDGWNVEEFTEAVYQQYGFGCGAEKDGVILLLSMEARDYDMAAYGYGNVAFTDYGKDALMDGVLPYLRENDWYGAFHEFIISCGSYLASARAGNPIDYYYTPAPPITPGKIILAVIIGLVTALIVSGVQKGKMKSAILQTRADRYMKELNLEQREDNFLRKETHRVKRQTSSSGGSRSGGGTTVHSSGFSHHSGKF